MYTAYHRPSQNKNKNKCNKNDCKYIHVGDKDQNYMYMRDFLNYWTDVDQIQFNFLKPFYLS